ncbi:T9SS type A sorting domain-containing protein [Flavobacterium sp. Fl-318]|uniref:T9SS type A sorting domain-containing protein n=1 Tax=Flavobacterium cupriresistens TaxID=2893885 RepID=A0ABU4RA23_9FLAO|nr:MULTISPECIES: T9SS type A sorting domain-containing protein [unclassified Flavobacterium]MDX6188499.1 T9SS type A sorting domain-containing protein [Flavobacterium sp. Fl-318]UFH44830.1 T9SS type A sorting domain-containing protein [Flavobacterium sp. F-323]
MKYYITLLVLGFSLLSKAQTKIKFSYDDAGNQISRILCINCTSKSVKEVKAIVEDDLEKFSKEDVISYYPNPVKEELYLQWELAQDNYVKFVQVYSMTGQVLRNYQTNETTKNLIISFQSFPSGVYIVLLSYKAGEDKSIKIVKQ